MSNSRTAGTVLLQRPAQLLLIAALLVGDLPAEVHTYAVDQCALAFSTAGDHQALLHIRTEQVSPEDDPCPACSIATKPTPAQAAEIARSAFSVSYATFSPGPNSVTPTKSPKPPVRGPPIAVSRRFCK